MNISTHKFATHTVLDNLPTIFICACLFVCQSVCLSVYIFTIHYIVSLSLSLSLSVHHFFHVLPLGPKSRLIFVAKHAPLKISMFRPHCKKTRTCFPENEQESSEKRPFQKERLVFQLPTIIFQGKGLVLVVV